MNSNIFYSGLGFNLCLFLYMKTLPSEHLWKHKTSNPPIQNGSPPGSVCHFPTEERLLTEVSPPCHFHSSFAARQAGAFPTNHSNFQSVNFQKWNFGQKNTTCHISRNSDPVNICIVATYQEISMS